MAGTVAERTAAGAGDAESFELGGVDPAREHRIVALDQQVVNRIAAGEVIHRPVSALKEMLENSLDAGSSSISVQAKGGGLKLLQIHDNGHGISREDFPKVCERFATSKLREYGDLEHIETFGFRGEALASISHVAHVTITSMTEGATCAYRACYADGQLTAARAGEEAEPKACAGTRGTQIVVEDMFYNVLARRNAMKSGAEEYAKLLQVMQAYAIDSAGVAMSCKKQGEASSDLHTLKEHSTVDIIRSIYGSALAKELVPLKGEEATIGLQVCGQLSNANFSAKKVTFHLFINKRLVESSVLRRTLEEVYAAYLPKGGHPFVYLSIRLPPESLDVNVHPTKREVNFLHKEEVLAAVQQFARDALISENTSRTFFTQALLPGLEVTAPVSSGEDRAQAASNSKPAYDPRKVVRNHSGMSAGELDKYICRPSSTASASSGSTPRGGNEGSARRGQSGGGKRSRPEAEAQHAVAEGAVARSDVALCVQPSSCGSKRVTSASSSDRTWVPCELTSVQTLLRRVTQQSNRALTAVFSQHVYVGRVDSTYVLLQHLTKLFVVHIGAVSESFFYQQALRLWGNLAAIQLKPPVSVYDLARAGLNDSASGFTADDDSEADHIALGVVDLLNEKAEMLCEYLSLEIVDGQLHSLPQLVAGYIPPLCGLPLFILRLATKVDWTAEQACFKGLAEQLAILYRVSQMGEIFTPPEEGVGDVVAGGGATCAFENGGHLASQCDEDVLSEAWTIQHVLLPAIRRDYEAPSTHASNGAVVHVACTEMLYKIFERC